VLPVSAATVELHGWVETRAQRAAAERAVRRVAGLETVINAVLVHGEDDTSAKVTDIA
jgi:osmotically-inducible protein OsmY